MSIATGRKRRVAPKLRSIKERVAPDWTKLDIIRRLQAARKLPYVTQRKRVHDYALELDKIASSLPFDGATASNGVHTDRIMIMSGTSCVALSISVLTPRSLSSTEHAPE